jgi:hypothetical protein
MSPSFSWHNFDRMARILESLGYMVAIFGPLLGIALLIFGPTLVRVLGLVIIVGSVLTALYHVSFSLLMDAIRTMIKRADADVASPDTEAEIQP